jgi:hypothetical protein
VLCDGVAVCVCTQADKAELAALKENPSEIDPDAESRARLRALRGEAPQPLDAAVGAGTACETRPPNRKPKFRTAQVNPWAGSLLNQVPHERASHGGAIWTGCQSPSAKGDYLNADDFYILSRRGLDSIEDNSCMSRITVGMQ